PVIWWLLRLTPPKPQTEIFPPLKILARVLKREETPQQSPWWLTLLRLLMAALIVAALADPVFNPREKLPAEGAALALVIDNDWASAADWGKRVATAERLINDAGSNGVPVVIAFTAEKANAEIGPFDAATALDRLRAAKPRPIPTDRPAVYARVAGVLETLPGASVAVLADGLAAKGDEAAFNTLLSKNAARVVWATADRLSLTGLTAADNQVDGFALTAIRAPGDPAPAQVTAGAFDDKGRRIADATLTFSPGETTATGTMAVPFELRNDFASIALDGERQAGAVRVLDESSKRRRVGLLSQAEADQAQPLLSPLYYIRRALQPFADLVEPSSADLADAIPQILDQKPAMIVMADIGTIPGQVRQRLVDWVDNGGTLVRFAGSRLATAGDDDDLLPVRLRTGERSLGGALSWTSPQPVTEFPKAGPFADLAPPTEVTVSRQVLAEPTPDIVERTWAALADGTPLVTGLKKGKGTLVLFHVTPEATWSNLPISGSFVEMLRRIVQLSRNQGAAIANAEAAAASLAPYRMIAADGSLVPPTPDARPLVPGAGALPVTFENPPGLYGSETGVFAHNLLEADSTLAPLARPQITVPVSSIQYAFDESRNLKGALVAAALVLMLLDTLAVFWMGGLFSRRPRRAGAMATTAAVLIALGSLFGHADLARADDAKPGDEIAIEAISKT
ncbi:RNA-binding protein, partial [Mesorhizobium sp. M7A.F.Ca.US.001.04.1.1]